MMRPLVQRAAPAVWARRGTLAPMTREPATAERLRAKQVSRPVGNREGPARSRSQSSSIDLTMHTTFLPHDDPDASLGSYRDTLGFEVRILATADLERTAALRRLRLRDSRSRGQSDPWSGAALNRPAWTVAEGGHMADEKQAKAAATRTAKSASRKASEGFTDEERAAMRERAQELKAAGRRGQRAGKADGERDVLEKIAEMPEGDRAMAERLHAIVKASAPGLSPRTWYGMPAYAKGGKVVCFFQSAQKFKTRYATLGFSDQATLDDGDMWPTAFALKELSAEVEAQIAALVKKAAG